MQTANCLIRPSLYCLIRFSKMGNPNSKLSNTTKLILLDQIFQKVPSRGFYYACIKYKLWGPADSFNHPCIHAALGDRQRQCIHLGHIFTFWQTPSRKSQAGTQVRISDLEFSLETHFPTPPPPPGKVFVSYVGGRFLNKSCLYILVGIKNG